MAISPTIRQVMVIGACMLGALSAGGAMGYPLVLLRQLSREDSPIKLNLDSSSWIGAAHGMAGIGSIVMPSFMQRAGRKSAFIVTCLCILLGWIVVYNAANATVIILSEIIHGFGTNSLYVVCMLCMSEMTAPRFRNTSVQSYGILQALGMAVSGMLSNFLYWKYVCMVMSVPLITALCLSMLWPQSPSWLACKGRFDECYESFMKLRKIDSTAKIELEELIAAQKENLLHDVSKTTLSFTFVWLKLKRRDFYLPAFHILVLLNMVYWSGSGVVLLSSFDIIQRTTKNDRAAFWGGAMMGVIYFLGLLINSMINKKYNNKTVLLASAVASIVHLFGVFLVSLLQSVDVIAKDSLLCAYFLIGYMTFDSLGVMPMSFTIVSELMPVKHRGVGGAVFVLFNSVSFGTALKLSPYLISYIDVWGTFLLYTINALICGLIIWRYVPETKNKTLQQIEDFYMYGRFIENRTEPVEYKSSA